MMKKQKGVLFTMDAFFSVMILTALISIFYFIPFLYSTSYKNRIKFALSIASYLEESRALHNIVENSSAALPLLLSLPSDTCVSISIFNEHGEEVTHVVKPFCAFPQYITIYRSFVLENGSIYYAMIRISEVEKDG